MRLSAATVRTLTAGIASAAVVFSLAVVSPQQATAAPVGSTVCPVKVSNHGDAAPHLNCTTVKQPKAITPATSGAQSPAPNPGSDMTNHGGQIMPTAVAYNVFWLPGSTHFESPGSSATDSSYEALLNRFFTDVGSSDYNLVASQYPGTNGSPTNAPQLRLAGSYTDTTAYPHAGSSADPLTDGDIQAAVSRAASTNGWTQDINHIYMIYTAFGIDECSSATSCNFPVTATGPDPTSGFNYCAYHTNFNGGNSIYAFMGDDASEQYAGAGCSIGSAPNGDTPADSEVSTASHEYYEAITDPHLDGWFHVDTSGEIGDLCAYNTGFTNSIGANLYLNGHPYIVQREWSNAVHGCSTDVNAGFTSNVPPSLTISKSGPATAVTGQTISYSITITNQSDTDAATLTTVSDTLPAGVTYVGGSSSPSPTSTSPLTWNLGTIAVHDAVTITYQATVSGPASISNCAGVTYDDELQITPIGPLAGCANTTISKGATSTAVVSSVNPSQFAQSVTFTATVAATAPASGTPTGSVEFFDGLTSLGTASLSGGQASLTTSALSVGSHPVTVVYAGDSNFLTSTSPVLTQVVTKQATTTTLVCAPPSPQVNQAVTCTATVTPTIANPTTPTGTVSFFVDGSITPAATVALSSGQAVWMSTFGGGTHTVVAVYNGDGNYLSSTSAPATETVACTVTITGTHSALTVTSGTTCVLNAHITGGISVAKGAVLDLENSTVSGSISANAPSTLRICGSHTGSISVSGATGFVLIGDPANNCPANTITGGITAANNKGGLVIIGNTVSGSITAAGNSGAGPLPGETTPIISGNHH